jgi:hypothetical protein
VIRSKELYFIPTSVSFVLPHELAFFGRGAEEGGGDGTESNL